MLKATEEALAVLDARGVVYFDPGASKWVSRVQPKDIVHTAFGKVTCIFMRGYDGTLLCAHPCGTVYLAHTTVAMDGTGRFTDIALLPARDEEEAAMPEGIQASVKAGNVRMLPTSIDLRGSFLDHGEVQRLCRGLSGNCFVTVLSLSGNQLQDSEASLLADALLHNGCLRELNLSYNVIGMVGSTLLATALSENHHVRQLDLMHNRIGSDGVHPWLGRTLRTNRSIEQLKLTHNDIGDGKVGEILTALSPKPVTEEEHLKHMIARRRTDMPAAVPLDSQAHKRDEDFNKTLTTLLLGNTGIGNHAAELLAHVLMHNHSLTHLDISSNRIGVMGHENIALGLHHNQSLRLLNCNDNNIPDPGGPSLVRSLVAHPAIETLLLQDCLRGSEAASALAALTRKSRTLKTLDISHCSLEPPGVVELYKAVGENNTLQALEMSCTGIKSDNAVSILARALEANHSLRFVNLSYNDITLRGCKMLRDAIGAPSGDEHQAVGAADDSDVMPSSIGARTAGAKLLLSLEGNSGEKKITGVTITCGLRQYWATMSTMEQYLLQLPKKLAAEMRASMGKGDGGKVELVSGADNKHFTFMLNGKEYPAKIAQMPCILETHKTYDENFFYKSGEIGQIFIVTDKEEERQVLEQVEEIPNGITPPNTNVIKRRFEKTKRYNPPFPKPDVARVEEDLVKRIGGGPVEDVEEELVDFYDWMVDEQFPNGLVVTDEMDLIRKHPEYLELTAEPPEKQRKTEHNNAIDGVSAINTPLVTDIGSENESQAGQESAQRSPAFAPTPSPNLSQEAEEDKEVDDLEDDILGDLEEKQPPSKSRASFENDPAYLKLVAAQERLQKQVRDAERDINELTSKVNANSNIVVKNRFKQMLETAQTQRNQFASELEKTRAEIATFEDNA
ncbi:TPA: hypothetical protein N0F65_002082 [Lagenidium giganteum]|uniref:TAFII55 protein conserved region domain-containing protein n=1 Tax=Lagenidium giganteum TaxID=4803 RepID=A0AAV2ZEF9_9STRA|nr:TPA: hypothetical protein N0F65_002082 [Lagenidium giganteum]